MGVDDLSGNSSCSKESSNETTERPFKKAKYAWQVKGRSHLRTSPPSSSLQQTDYHLAEKERLEKEKYLAELRQIKDASSCDTDCHHSCDYIHRILHTSEKLMSDDTESEEDVSVKRKCFHHNQGPSMVPFQNNERYHYFLHQWQARQLAKSYVDNTINAALERWMISPYEGAVDFVENSENDEFVEDEGILMAIRSHGLQSQFYERRQALVNAKKPTKAYGTIVVEDCSDEESAIPTIDEQGDFLSAAVGVAIQEKGLNI